MAEDSDLEKTEQASDRRLEKAREQGDVPRSRELATCAVLFTSGLGLMMMGDQLSQALKNTLSTGLQFNRALAFEPNLLFVKISDMIKDLVIAFAPFAFLLVLVAIASPVLIGGWVFSNQALLPQFNRLNPLQGIANLFSKNAIFIY